MSEGPRPSRSPTKDFVLGTYKYRGKDGRASLPIEPIFTDEDATDQSYINTRAGKNEYSKKHRENCERLWEQYEPCADPEFRKEFRSNFDARYWEMYLAITLKSLGHVIHCPKPGPDVGIEVDGLRIWFEATSPERGQDGSQDQVPEIKFDVGDVEVPNEKIVLRYLNSIEQKKKQHSRWIKKQIVGPKDAFIIAINPRQIGFDCLDGLPPRILQAAFTVGNPYVTFGPNGKSGFHFRSTVEKTSGASVATGVFQQEDYAFLSGLLCSRIDVANQPPDMGRDFQLVPNPHATVMLPQNFRLLGTFYRVECTNNGYIVAPEVSHM